MYKTEIGTNAGKVWRILKETREITPALFGKQVPYPPYHPYKQLHRAWVQMKQA